MRIRPRRVAVHLTVLGFIALVCTVWYYRHPSTVRSHSGLVDHVVTSPDGSRVASVGRDGVIEVWGLSPNRHLFTLGGHIYGGEAVAFSPDGNILATGCADNAVRAWSVPSGDRLQTFSGHAKPVRAVAYSPDGQTIASTSEDGAVKLWDAISADELFTHRVDLTWGFCLAFSPDGKTLAMADKGRIRLLDLATRQVRANLTGHRGFAGMLNFSPDGKTLALAERPKGEAKLWDVVTGAELPFDQPEWGDDVADDNDVITGLAFSPDGTTLALATDNVVGLWDVATRKNRAAFGWGYRMMDVSIPAVLDSLRLLRKERDRFFRSVAFTRDGDLLAFGMDGGRFKVWKLNVPSE